MGSEPHGGRLRQPPHPLHLPRPLRPQPRNGGGVGGDESEKSPGRSPRSAGGGPQAHGVREAKENRQGQATRGPGSRTQPSPGCQSPGGPRCLGPGTLNMTSPDPVQQDLPTPSSRPRPAPTPNRAHVLVHGSSGAPRPNLKKETNPSGHLSGAGTALCRRAQRPWGAQRSGLASAPRKVPARPGPENSA